MALAGDCCSGFSSSSSGGGGVTPDIPIPLNFNVESTGPFLMGFLSEDELNSLGLFFSNQVFTFRLNNTGPSDLIGVSFSLADSSGFSVNETETSSPFNLSSGDSWDFSLNGDSSLSENIASLIFSGGISAEYEVAANYPSS